MSKPLPANIQSVGDAIPAARQTKNLAPSHTAAKMGIAAALFCGWEEGIALSNKWQLSYLAEILEL